MATPDSSLAPDGANFLTLLESLSEKEHGDIKSACVKVSLKPGDMVYHQGEPADAIYIVASGLVEALTFSPDGKQSRSVALMGQGDFFGDLAIFTEQPRIASIRVREAAELWRIDKDDFLRLMKAIPGLGLFFTRVIARRLHRTSTEAHHHVYAIDLTGNLQRFDLLTIVQAITSMGLTGELWLNNSANELLGSFFFQKGRVEHARFGSLRGLEAIWQGFIEAASEGTFSFRSVEKPSTSCEDADRIDMESTSLLLEGVGKRDTFHGLPGPLRKLEGSLHRVAEKLEWGNAENKALAEKIWGLIAEPATLTSLRKHLNISAISLLDVVMEMGMSGQAEVFMDESKLDA